MYNKNIVLEDIKKENDKSSEKIYLQKR